MPRRRWGSAFALAWSIAITLPVAAQAATAGLEGSRLVFAAGGGEANAVRISLGEGTLVVEDTGALLSPGTGCHAASLHTVTCPAPASLALSLGDDDDAADLSAIALPATVDGGPGADAIVASAAGSQIDGGEGDDRLDGRAGADVLTGGPGADAIDGGAGDDRLSGGAGDDLLRGGDGADEAHGGDGNDHVFGAGDPPGAGDGRDRLFGEQGDDDVSGIGPGPDLVDGGPGANRLSGEDDDELLPDTEAPAARIASRHLRVARSGGGLLVTVTCPKRERHGCILRGALEVLRGHRYSALARGRLSLDAGASGTLRFRIGRSRFRTLAAARVLRISLEARDHAGNTTTVRRRYRASGR